MAIDPARLVQVKTWSPKPPRAWEWSTFTRVSSYIERMGWLATRAKKAAERRHRAN